MFQRFVLKAVPSFYQSDCKVLVRCTFQSTASEHFLSNCTLLESTTHSYYFYLYRSSALRIQSPLQYLRNNFRLAVNIRRTVNIQNTFVAPNVMELSPGHSFNDCIRRINFIILPVVILVRCINSFYVVNYSKEVRDFCTRNILLYEVWLVFQPGASVKIWPTSNLCEKIYREPDLGEKLRPNFVSILFRGSLL